MTNESGQEPLALTAEELAEIKAKFESGWLPIDEPKITVGDEFVDAIKAGTVDHWSYDADADTIRCDDHDRHRIWRLTGNRGSTGGQEAVWPD